MNWEQISGNWMQLKGRVKERWGKITDDELTKSNGRRDQIAGLLEKRYGYEKEQIEKELDEFSKALKS